MARRTIDRRPGASPAVAATRPIVRDMSGQAGRLQIDFDARTAYDFVVSVNIAAGDDADLLPADAAWLERARAAMPAGAQAALTECFGEESMGVFHALPSLLVSHEDVRDARGFVDLLGEMTPPDLTRLFIVDMLRKAGAAELTDAIVAGDGGAMKRAQALLDERQYAALETFLADAATRIETMRSVLSAWLPLYIEVEERVAGMLERDVASRATDRTEQASDVATLIERTTGGLRWFPEPGVRRVVMAPSYFARPYNYIYQGADWRLFAYPISDAALGAIDPSTPPQSTVRLYRALGDATRMRVLRLLSERDWYLTELAQQLELSKPTMKHHLALLRAAGLVTVTEQGGMTYYALRRERLQEAGVELQRFIG